MSYELRLFRPVPGASLESEAQRVRGVEHETIADEPRPRNVAKDAENERLAASLIAAVPTLQRMNFDYESIAEMLECSADDARLRVRYHELDEHRLGIMITLFEGAATVSLAQEALAGAGPEDVQSAITALWRVLEVCQRYRGMRAFDDQLKRVLELEADFDAVLESYRATVSGA